MSDIYSVFATKTERFKHLPNEYFANTVLRAPLTKGDSRPRSLSHRAIVCGRFDKLPNNCQMLENDEVERTALEQGSAKARERYIDRPYSILSSRRRLYKLDAANLTDIDYPALKESDTLLSPEKI